MCTVCGCGPGETRIEGSNDHAGHEHEHIGPDGTVTRHSHHHHGHTHHGHGHHNHHDHEIQPSRLIKVEQDILAKNNRFAAVNRQLFAASNTLTLNLMSSPGSGKTTLLVRTLTDLRDTRSRWPSSKATSRRISTQSASALRAPPPFRSIPERAAIWMRRW